jgi:hypothetical protein
MTTHDPENERSKHKCIAYLTAPPGIDAVFAIRELRLLYSVPPYNCAIGKRIPRFVFRVFLSLLPGSLCSLCFSLPGMTIASR